MMKIAIVAPSPVPFTAGGAENLCWGLAEHINHCTPYQADLIKLPSREDSFWELLDTYRAFTELDLSHFDLVISTKYPSWMVRHDRHVCYMVHCLRGLYDTYRFTGLPERYESRHPLIRRVRAFIRNHWGLKDALAEFFELLEFLRGESDLPVDALRFPGPFIREIIHFLDGVGLASNHIHKYAAISRTVAGRRDYFPQEAHVQVIYPPSPLGEFRCGRQDYLFTASRLDGPKRVELLIKAMAFVSEPIPLKIAGTGPDKDRLRELATKDKRIEFLDFVPNQELVDLYANALAVPYVPFDEDYGFITIEAMMSEKPIITCVDSGGPNEFVIDGENGYSVAPDPIELAKAIDLLWKNPEMARSMGQRGRRSIEIITWESTVERLLDGEERKFPSACKPKRKKITVAVTFPIYPPRGGGQSRIYQLYKHIAQGFDVELITLANLDDSPIDREIAPGLREIRIQKSAEHTRKEWELEKEVGIPVTDVAFPLLFKATPEYVSALQRSVERSDWVVASHPYVLPAIRDTREIPLVYDAQDVEFLLKQQVLPDNHVGRQLLEVTREIEAQCCERSTFISVCSLSDAESLARLYHISSEKIVEVPNGVDLANVPYIDRATRQQTKDIVGLPGTFIALFMGSWHPPNVEAVTSILELAEQLPRVLFLVIGSVGLYYRDRKIAKNVGMMGVVSHEEKATILSLADVSLNPMSTGSGTNLKMLEYMAAGIPVITTSHGARGLGIESNKTAIICPLEEFPRWITKVMRKKNLFEEQAYSARQFVEQRFDWAVISKKLYKTFQESFCGTRNTS